MDVRIERLDGPEAVQILRNVARRWILERGIEAFVVIDSSRREFGAAYDNPPPWLLAPAANAAPDLVELSKLALSAIVEGEDPGSVMWIEEELEELEHARAQMIDPVTLGIVGATIVGIILASRVKKLGNVEFYEGVPKETVDMVKHATTIVVPSK